MVPRDLGPCSVDGCENEADRDTTQWGFLCPAHRKRTQRVGDLGTATPVQKPRTPEQRLQDSALEFADADSEDDREAALVLGRLRRAAAAYASQLAQEASRRALKRLRAMGKHIGRPPKLDIEGVRHAIRETGSIRKAAGVLRVTEGAIRYVLKKHAPKKPRVSTQRRIHALAPPPSPPEAGG